MVNADNAIMIGIDVGATKIAAALVTIKGQVLAASRENIRTDLGPINTITQITRIANQLIQQVDETSDLSPSGLMGIGIGIPGQVNVITGIVRQAVNLGWTAVDLVTQIRHGLIREVPISIDTDTNAGTLGEYFFGAARGCADFVFLSIGSGLGAGLYVNGSLVRGTSWKAAELGHISLNVEGLPCKCGLRGCAETVISGPGLLHLVEKLRVEKRSTSQLSSLNSLTPAEVIAAARNGDELALAAITEMGHNLGTVISICIAVTNPGLVVIGGGLGLASFDLLLSSIEAEIRRRILPSLYSHIKIVPSQLENNAVGAACLRLNQAKSEVMV